MYFEVWNFNNSNKAFMKFLSKFPICPSFTCSFSLLFLLGGGFMFCNKGSQSLYILSFA